MNWTEIKIKVPTAATEQAAAIANMTVSHGIYIEDYSDLEEKAEEIAEFLISHSPRGVTMVQGEGMYSKRDKGVLLTCVKNNQVVALKNSIKMLDEDAFVIVSDANEVYGKGFKKIAK